MKKGGGLFLISFSLILIISLSFISAGFFSDSWSKITGQAMAPTNGESDEPYEPPIKTAPVNIPEDEDQITRTAIKCYNNDIWKFYGSRPISKTIECGSVGCSGSVCLEETQNEPVCKSHANYKCSYGDVFWYNSCGNKEDKKQECGAPGCSYVECIKVETICLSHNSVKCSYGDVFWYNSCGNKEDKKQECGAPGCSYGECIPSVEEKRVVAPDDSIEANVEPEQEEPYCNPQHYTKCSYGDVYWYDSCNNKGKLKQDCPARGCYNGACLGVSETTACTDSDKGNIYRKGITKGTWKDGSEASYLEDDCEDKTTLVEYFCESGFATKKIVDCPTDCSNGACIPSQPLDLGANNCTESDGGDNKWEAGSVKGYDGGEYFSHKDYCYSSSTLREYYCYQNNYESVLLVCAYGCQDDACMNAPANNDSNGTCVKNTFWQGCSNNDIYYFDNCGGQEKAKECGSLGCSDNASECNPPVDDPQTTSCTDTDNGPNAYKAGTCTDSKGNSIKDSCLTEDGQGPITHGAYLSEAFCLTEDMLNYYYQNGGQGSPSKDECYLAQFLPDDNFDTSFFQKKDAHICNYGCSEGKCITAFGKVTTDVRNYLRNLFGISTD